jgi:two-component system, NarL family, response regulator NreC
MKRLKFILVDDNDTYREVLKTLLIRKYDAIILAEASNADEMLKINNLNEVDIILMDLMMPGKNGINLAKELLWYRKHDLKIIAITLHADKVYLVSLIEAGFKGCILKNDLVKQIGEAIEEVMNSKIYFPEEIFFDSKDKNHKIS